MGGNIFPTLHSDTDLRQLRRHDRNGVPPTGNIDSQKDTGDLSKPDKQIFDKSASGILLDSSMTHAVSQIADIAFPF